MLETIGVTTHSRIEFRDITAQVESVINRSPAVSGMCLVFVPHTTAAVTINENADPSVGRDMDSILSRLVPASASYVHSEGNSDAHAKAALVGSSVLIPCEAGRLALGTWQGVFFCEFDGPRDRRVLIKLIADRVDQP